MSEPVAAGWHHGPDGGQQDEADRDVDEEDPAPAGAAGEDSADEHPGGEAEAAEGGPHAQGLVALLAEEDAGDGRQRSRGQQRGPGALTDAAADQHDLVLRQATAQRSEG